MRASLSPVIAIDGPSASGKGTVAMLVAQRKSGLVVVKRALAPALGRVAALAVRAHLAFVDVVLLVAARARLRRVQADEREGGMAERPLRPGRVRRLVAQFALGREPRGLVRRPRRGFRG